MEIKSKRIEFPYTDENGTILYQKIRIENNDGSKDYYFEQERNGTIIKSIDGCRKVLYALPQILQGISAQKSIFLVEGEKDAHTLLSHQLFATTPPTTLEWCDEFTEILKRASVIILYDNDKTGIKRKNLLCETLYGKVQSLRVIDLPGLEYREKHGLDITDWLAIEGNTIESFISLVKQTPFYHPKDRLIAITLDELLALKLPEQEMLLMPFLPSQGLVMLVAKRGVGKTHIALGIAYAVATGGVFLKWTAPTAKKVLYIDGEMPAILMQERLKMIKSMMPEHSTDDNLKFITPDLQSRTMPDLSTDLGRSQIEEFIQDTDLIIIDNISCLFRSGSENEAEAWQQAQEWALDLRRRGKSILFVHHAGKSGIQRGTSKREDILDTVIMLKHPDNYKAEDGAYFEILFDKARNFTGSDAISFQVQLRENQNGSWSWELSDTPTETQLLSIAEMKKNGLTIKDICTQTKLTKSQVEWRTIKAKEKGLL